MNVILEHGFVLFSFSTSNIEASSIGMSPDDVPLMGKLSLLCSVEFEPTAGMFASIGDDVDGVVLFVLEDAQCLIVLLVDNGELVVFLDDVEVLVFVVVVLVNLEFVVFVDGQDQVGIEDRVDFV
jgi:hypothetical protein